MEPNKNIKNIPSYFAYILSGLLGLNLDAGATPSLSLLFYVAILICAFFSFSTNIKIKTHPYPLYLCAVVLPAAVLSSLLEPNQRQPELIVKLVLAIIILFSLLNGQLKWIKAAIFSNATSLVIISGLALNSIFLLESPYLANSLWEVTHNNKNQIALSTTIQLSICLLCLNIENLTNIKRFFIFSFFIHALALVYIQSRGAWVTAAATIFLFILIYIKTKRIRYSQLLSLKKTIGLTFITIFLIAIAPSTDSIQNRFHSLITFEDEENESSLSNRVALLKESLITINNAPFHGDGLGGFAIKNEKATHNTYLQHFSESGLILGTFINLTYLLLPIYFLLKLAFFETKRNKKTWIIFAASLAPSFYALFINYYFTPIIFFYYGLLLSVARQTKTANCV